MKILLMCLFVVGAPLIGMTEEEKANFKFPEFKTVYVYSDGVKYVLEEEGETPEGEWYGTSVRYHTDPEGSLERIRVVKNDQDFFSWEKEEGVSKGDRELLEQFKSKFEEVYFPVTFIERLFPTAPIEKIEGTHFSGDEEFELVGDTWQEVKQKYVIREVARPGILLVVSADEFIFPPPKVGTFQLGRKMDKFICLREVGDSLVVPVTDYYTYVPKQKRKEERKR